MSIQPPELITVDDDADEVRCDGGDGALGHPVVWYSFDNGDFVECGYCDRGFVKKRAKSQAGAKTAKTAKKTAKKAAKKTPKKKTVKKSAKKSTRKTAKKSA